MEVKGRAPLARASAHQRVGLVVPVPFALRRDRHAGRRPGRSGDVGVPIIMPGALFGLSNSQKVTSSFIFRRSYFVQLAGLARGAPSVNPSASFRSRAGTGSSIELLCHSTTKCLEADQSLAPQGRQDVRHVGRWEDSCCSRPWTLGSRRTSAGSYSQSEAAYAGNQSDPGGAAPNQGLMSSGFMPMSMWDADRVPVKFGFSIIRSAGRLCRWRITARNAGISVMAAHAGGILYGRLVGQVIIDISAHVSGETRPAYRQNQCK